MVSATPDTVQLLADRFLIEDLPKRYAHGIDARDWDAVDACFSPKAIVQGTRHTGQYPEYIADLRPGVEKYQTTMHFFGNQLTDFTGADSAHLVTYGVAFHLGSDGEDFVIGVRYIDDVEREGDRWWITKRIVKGVWHRPLAGEIRGLT
jgi:hypothetical protein